MKVQTFGFLCEGQRQLNPLKEIQNPFDQKAAKKDISHENAQFVLQTKLSFPIVIGFDIQTLIPIRTVVRKF